MDIHGRNFLIIYIRTLEYDYARVYFYALKKVETETASGLFQIIEQQLSDDNLQDDFKKRLWGFASDGASVMTGVKSGLGTLFKTNYNNRIYTIHCMAHKLQLVMGHAYDDLPYLKDEFEATVNGIYSFFNKHAVKRKASLRITAEAFQMPLYELVYIHEIRWVASELKAVQKLRQSLPTILENLKQIKESDDFDKDSKATATGFLKKLTDAKFYVTMAFMEDVLKVIADRSLELQNHAASLINQEEARLELLKAITELKEVEVEGNRLEHILQHCKCFKDADFKSCNIKDLDNKKMICDKTVFEHHQRSAYKPLSQLREEFIDAVINHLSSYFPEGSLEMFDALNPASLPLKLAAVPDFADKIQNLAERLGSPRGDTSREYEKILKVLITDHFETYKTHKSTDSPVQFWGYFLNFKEIHWTDRIRQVITITLSLPVSTADAERGFSILKNSLDHRHQLTPEHLQDVLFIRINGPSIEKFDASSYTRHWLQTGMRSDDTSWQKKGQRKQDVVESIIF